MRTAPEVETLFGLLTLLPLPWWLCMLLFPRARVTRTLVMWPWTHVGFGGVYAMLLLAALSSGELPPSLDLGALMAAATGAWAFLAVWTHLLALNLFAGIWIFRDARYFGELPRAELAATWLAGPLGLGVYLWRRRTWTAKDPVRVVN